jgi:hypothetical protein
MTHSPESYQLYVLPEEDGQQSSHQGNIKIVQRNQAQNLLPTIFREEEMMELRAGPQNFDSSEEVKEAGAGESLRERDWGFFETDELLMGRGSLMS